MTDKEMANCNICVNRAFCHYRRIAFESGTISWESHLNMVEKLGCGYYKSKLPEDSIVLTKEQIEHPTDDKVIEFFAKHNEKVRKITVEEILNEIDKELYDISRLYLECVAKNSKDDDAINNYGVMTIAHNVVVNVAKQYGVEIKEQL